MNREDRGILVGMVLGDGHIRTATAADKAAGRRIAAQLTFSHSLQQQEYAAYKLDLLNKMFCGKATLRFHEHAGYKFCSASKSNPYLRTLKGMMYVEGRARMMRRVLDMLTPQGIAIWFMDDGSYRMNKRPDGSVSSVSLTICSYGTREEIDAVIGYFADAHAVDFRPAYEKRVQLWYVRTNTTGARQFAALIAPYVIPSMSYKLSCVQELDSHECRAPDKTCDGCGKTFATLKAKGLCMKCYNDRYFAELAQTQRRCESCGDTKPAQWFVGDRCRACYQRERRVMR